MLSWDKRWSDSLMLLWYKQWYTNNNQRFLNWSSRSKLDGDSEYIKFKKSKINWRINEWNHY